jgi:predicted phosphate transport protein (TIGR00153 family)
MTEPLDARLRDDDALAEIDLASRLMIAASGAEKQLSQAKLMNSWASVRPPRPKSVTIISTCSIHEGDTSVRFKFRPVEATFYDLFTEAANHLVVGADLVAGLLDPSNDQQELVKKMHDAEHDADETTHSIINLVNSTFITPFDREDIYALASGLDDIMDYMDEVVDCAVLYGVDEFPQYFAGQVEILQQAAKLTAEAMPRLRTMKDLKEFWIEINRLENEGDRNHRRILADLFNGNYKAIQVLKLKDIVESLNTRSTASRKWPTRSNRSQSRSPE